MWFGYYPEIIFCHFFCNLNLVIFKCFYYQSEKIVGTLCAQLHSCFGHGLKICMWFGYNPQIINNNGGGHKFSEFACFSGKNCSGKSSMYCQWNPTVDIESERRCQVDMSIKMVQSCARCRLVCSFPAYCVKFLTMTLRTIWEDRKAKPTCV